MPTIVYKVSAWELPGWVIKQQQQSKVKYKKKNPKTLKTAKKNLIMFLKILFWVTFVV